MANPEHESPMNRSAGLVSLLLFTMACGDPGEAQSRPNPSPSSRESKPAAPAGLAAAPAELSATPSLPPSPEPKRPPPPEATLPMLIGGFAHPESVIHDTVDDVYLVSNVAGEPVEHDNNGFISRVAPSGEVLELEWVKAGQLPSLDAPKGLAIVGDVLVVTDIDSLIFINRKTGAGLYDMSLGGEFFNDVAVDQDGRVVFTDTGFPDGKHEVGGRQSVFISESRGGFQSMGGSMAWSLDWKRGPNHPNGIAVRDGALLVVTMGSGSLWELGLEPDDEGGFSAKPRQLGDPKTIPNSLDGLVVLEDGRLLVSSWDTNTVYEVSVDSTEWTPIIEDVPSPADIGYDRTRKRVLIPCFTTNELRIHQLPGHSVPGAPARLGHGKP